PYLKGRIPPVSVTVEPAVIERLLGDLASEQYPVRNKAEVELGKLGELAETALRKALEQKSTLEVRRRVEKLLQRLQDARTDPPADQWRILRVIEALESLRSPAAIALLQGWAKGTPGVLLTREATEALKRLH